MKIIPQKPNRPQAKESYAAAYVILFILTLCYILVAMALALLSWIAWGTVRDAHASKKYHSTEGSVTAFVLTEDRMSTDQMTLIESRIQYAYKVNSEEFTAIAAKEPRDQPHSQLPDWEPENVRVGSKVTVFYDPNSPQTSRLVTGITAEDWFAPIICLIFNIAFAAISVAVFKSILRMRRRLKKA